MECLAFLMLNDKVKEHLTKYPEAAERIRQALQWLKRNNDLYKTFYLVLRPSIGISGQILLILRY